MKIQHYSKKFPEDFDKDQDVTHWQYAVMRDTSWVEAIMIQNNYVSRSQQRLHMR